MGRCSRPRAPRKPGLRYLGLLAALAWVPSAEAGGWPRDKGETLLILTNLVDRADGYFDADRQRQSGGHFYKDELAAYIEYGATDRVTLVGRFAWQNVDQLSGGRRDAAQGFSASELGVRALIWRRDDWVVSGQLSHFVPGEGENVTNQPLGQGEGAFDLRLLVGRALPRDGFLDVQLAHRARDGRYLDEWRMDTSLGFAISERWSAMVQSYSVWSAEETRPGLPEFDQHKLQFSVLRTVGEVDYQIGVILTPSGRNALDERAAVLSVWRRF